jgi:glycosyltransferase involved in cell wall biosynthesis
MKAIGLCMIVKNEAHVIERCLRSVRPLIDYVLIQDTGSSDGTQDIIRDYLAREGLHGEVFDEPWQNFAANRTIGLQRLRRNAAIDYALVMDADDILVLPDGFDPLAFKAGLDKDVYNIELRRGGTHYTRPQLLSNSHPLLYKGVLHEYVELGDCSTAEAAGLHILSTTEGARGLNPRKYLDDAHVLERALETEADPFLRSRYTYYLAQSYRDAGALEQALTHFLARAELGYWVDEVYVSLLGAARVMQTLGRPLDDVLAVYDRASATCAWRAEALHGAAQLCNQNNRPAQAYAIAKRGLDLKNPQGGLFVEAWIYDYGMRDEFAVAAYWAGAYAESLDACITLLGGGALPAPDVPRVAANARFAFDKLPATKNLGALGTESFLDQFPLGPERQLRTRIDNPPSVLVAILAKQMAAALPLYLQCLESLDYPKKAITLYVRTNNNTDDTERLLRAWLAQVGHLYAGVEFDAADVTEPVHEFGVREWNTQRFAVMGRLRNACLQKTLAHRCDFLFFADVDNFVRPGTLRNLVSVNLPIVAPLLRSIEHCEEYANYFSETDESGYFAHSDQYDWVLQRRVRGLIEMPVVHCTYLVRADVIPELVYLDGSGRHEFVVFSDSARRAGIPQYIDNRQIYGYLGRDALPAQVVQARELLRDDLERSGNCRMAQTVAL